MAKKEVKPEEDRFTTPWYAVRFIGRWDPVQGKIIRYSPEEERKKNAAQDAEVARLRKEARAGAGPGKGADRMKPAGRVDRRTGRVGREELMAKQKRNLDRFTGPWYAIKFVGKWDPVNQRILPPTEADAVANAEVDAHRRKLAGPVSKKQIERMERRMAIPASAIKHVGTWDPKTGRVIPDDRTEV